MKAFPNVNELGPNAEFFLVDEAVVAVDDLAAIRYDGPEPIMFDLAAVMEDGVEITREEFMQRLSASP